VGLFAVPNSVKAITPLVGQIQIESEAHRAKGEYARVYVFHKPSEVWGALRAGKPAIVALDTQWLQGLAKLHWPTANLPEVMRGGTATLRALIASNLFISLFRACAESLASENASRLAAMQRADKNIDEFLSNSRGPFIVCAKTASTRKLFDVIAGFEAAFKRRGASGLRMTEAPLSRRGILIPRLPRNGEN